tara:strand:+ start:9150 stop:10862 length:1713 start_codon:yes stop_codon:yes gene_type:complete
MLLTLLTLLSALSISAVAIFYSIAGLAAIFAGAAVPIMIMGTVLEVGKLVTASWLYQNWKKSPFFLKFYLTIAVVVLMFITSMGIFGFLSKAHVEQTAPSTLITQKIEQIDDRLVRENSKVERFTLDLERLNTGTNVRIDTLVDTEQEKLDSIYSRIDKEIADITAIANTNIGTQKERITQAKERADRDIAQLNEARAKTWGKKRIDDEITKIRDNELAVAAAAQKEIIKIQEKLNVDIQAIKDKYQASIDAITTNVTKLTGEAEATTGEIEIKAEEIEGKLTVVYANIDDLNEEKFVLQSKIKEIEVEVGPIKYIAEFVYGTEADADLLEKSVRWVIIIIIFVFDPLAVLLLIAANFSLKRRFGSDMEEMIEGKFGGGKLDDYWKDRYKDMKDDLSRFNKQKEQQDDTPEPSISTSYDIGEVNAEYIDKPVEDYLDEVQEDTEWKNILGHPDYDLKKAKEEAQAKTKEVEELKRKSRENNNMTDGFDPAEVEGFEEFNKKYEEPEVDKEKQLEEFKKREEEEKQALEEYSRKAREEDESVSITEDEVTPTIIEDVKITDLSDDDAKKKT